MRSIALTLLLLTITSVTGHTQDALTKDQRIEDLTQLANMYTKNYAPYEWKRDTQDFDLLRLTPWIQRVRHSDDLEFQEELIEYVASLNDAHDFIAFPTTFSASLPMNVDIYDGKVLIEAMNPLAFPGAISFASATSSCRSTAARSCRSSRASGSTPSPPTGGAPIAWPPAASSAAASRSCRTSPGSGTTPPS